MSGFGLGFAGVLGLFFAFFVGVCGCRCMYGIILYVGYYGIVIGRGREEDQS